MSTAETADCVVVGAGLAGLSAAHRLAAAGHAVIVLEREDAAGGRTSTSWIDGVPVDRGFQSLFAAYPETRDFMDAIGIGRDDLRALRRGAVFHTGSSWAELSPSPRDLLRFPALGAGDVARLGRLAAEVAGRSPASLLAGPEQHETAAGHLAARGFSQAAIDGFFRPLIGVITLDRTLSTDAAYVRFLVSMLVRGPAVLPVDGHGMIAARAVEDVRRRGGDIRMGTEVESVLVDGAANRVTGVRLRDGGEIAARAVVLAVPADVARGLLGPHDPDAVSHMPDAPSSALTLAYLMDRPLYRGRTIVLNAAPPEPGPRVDLVCQTTNAIRPHGGAPHVLLAMSVTTGEDPPPDADAVDAAVTRLMGRWAPGIDWTAHARRVDAVAHPAAQFRVTPGVRAALPGARTRVAGLVLAGDLTTHPSIEGAVTSGRVAAEVAAEALPAAG